MSSGDGADQFDPLQYEFDESPNDANLPVWLRAEQKGSERVAVIRTTDRMVFRRCRRKWGWSSHLRGNLGSREGQSPLWMGSGFHFALEDYHGLNLFKDPAVAFDAFAEATKRHDPKGLPPNYLDDWDLARGMLDYYARHWLRNRDPLKTFIYNDIPQVEVNFRVDLPLDPELLKRYGFDRAEYSGTLDRVIEDEWGQLWIVEYKTAKSIQTLHLANDSQVSSYCWAGPYIYGGRPVVGVIYQQHRKDLPKPPKILANGMLSTAKDQLTTRPMLREYLLNQYGTIEKVPGNYVDMLNYLAREETPNRDKFVYRSKIPRNQAQCQAEGEKIMLEAADMLNPDLPMYPNPDRSCQFLCQFNGACVSMDDGSDFQYDLDLTTKPREAKYDSWRNLVRWPGSNTNPFEGTEVNG